MMDSTPARPLLRILLAHHQLHLQLQVIDSYIRVENYTLVKCTILESSNLLHFPMAMTRTNMGVGHFDVAIYYNYCQPFQVIYWLFDVTK